MKTERVIIKEGDRFKTKNFGVCEIIKYNNSSEVTVKFLSTGFLTVVAKHNLLKGRVRDAHFPNAYGVGYLGKGKYKSNTRCYATWRSMLERCYCPKRQERYPSYIGCTVSEEWWSFQNFAEWYENKPFNKINELDKDLLKRGNKLYSPENCCLVPKNINIALQEKRSNCGSFPPGVYFKKKNRNFIAQLALGDGIQKHLGSFDTYEKAREVYVIEKKKQLESLAILYKDQLEYAAYEALLIWEPQ